MKMGENVRFGAGAQISVSFRTLFGAATLPIFVKHKKAGAVAPAWFGLHG